ncbi:uncharacterized protein BO96DRAFT_336962 [Aspergillus niger CBS 101883]|uniref:Uncharacterized protein n=3 Tax=Aspergillus niger TaxID=5061 RepID=A2QWL5_ASPNC|nr:uncharacterized protein BO96DRAFT_336962 [Aspergillus niger CBS 101883]XP_059601612.1 hypothetical protein An11g05620 [Aspergillus niger]PYH56969.1 hypothetical protein BO96DRAFT_336962 [Aspergillus niger CBS 101883]RDH21215.1 hypothetical protein M747DRAFT_235795 [Aspergillus niger ATCC 13496]CAK40719.1 hypothetical protein An11g05620 [Aspergillus niger]
MGYERYMHSHTYKQKKRTTVDQHRRRDGLFVAFVEGGIEQVQAFKQSTGNSLFTEANPSTGAARVKGCQGNIIPSPKSALPNQLLLDVPIIASPKCAPENPARPNSPGHIGTRSATPHGSSAWPVRTDNAPICIKEHDPLRLAHQLSQKPFVYLVDDWEPGGSVVGILSCLVPARTSPEFASAPALTIYRYCPMTTPACPIRTIGQPVPHVACPYAIAGISRVIALKKNQRRSSIGVLQHRDKDKVIALEAQVPKTVSFDVCEVLVAIDEAHWNRVLWLRTSCRGSGLSAHDVSSSEVNPGVPTEASIKESTTEEWYIRCFTQQYVAVEVTERRGVGFVASDMDMERQGNLDLSTGATPEYCPWRVLINELNKGTNRGGERERKEVLTREGLHWQSYALSLQASPDHSPPPWSPTTTVYSTNQRSS